MKAIDFKEVNVKIAEHQEQYETLPAFYNAGEGSVAFCFQLSEEELATIMTTGKFWFKVLTGGRPMQPIILSTDKEQLIKKGQLNGLCGLSSCTSGLPANWYNHGSYKHYCPPCADRLNNDPVNKADALSSFGHELCTKVE